MQMSETVLFSFPAVGLNIAGIDDTPSTGFLVLTSSHQPTEFDPSRYDIYLRLQHSPESSSATSDPIDVLIEAWRELCKISPTTFILGSNFGDLTITFPDLHTLIPQNDGRVDVPTEVKSLMTWEGIVREFESEIDRFVSYRKNSFSLIDGAGNTGYDFPPEKAGGVGASTEKAKEAGYGGAAPDYAPAGGDAASIAPYHPATYSDEKKTGRVVLIDEENGNEVGEMGGLTVQTQGIQAGSKDPVEITLPQHEGEAVMVRPADYLKDALDPAYQNSSLVQTAVTASRLLVTTSGYISSAMLSGSRTFTEKVKPNTTPMTFQPSTHTRMQQLHNFSAGAAKISSATIGKVGHFAQNAGAKLAGKGDRTRGKPSNPGLLNKSLIAFGTIADGIDYASKSLLQSTSTATSSMVGHKYGAEAGEIARTVTGSMKNVGLVYIDAAGVSRRAVVKGVAKGMVVGKVKGGGSVIVPGNEHPPIDGIPQGWGDGPLGGAHPGPPSIGGRKTPVQSIHDAQGIQGTATPPPGYGSSQNMYFPPPPGSEGAGRSYSPAPPSSLQGQYSGSVNAHTTGTTMMSSAVNPKGSQEKEHGGWRF